MKSLFLALLVSGCLVLAGCKKHTTDVTVVLDCTGTYLRVDNTDYKVCNIEKLNGFASGTKVSARFEKNKACVAANSRFECYALHASAGWIEVTHVVSR